MDHKNGWNYEVFRERYSEVLDRYDYIVGDWGYNQLRLKGFFKEPNNKGAKEASITHLHDYLNEYCNFGCAYFIIEKLASRKGQPERTADEGDETEPDVERLLELEKGKDGDFKPRQHYHRSRELEQRHRGGQDKAAIAGQAAAAIGAGTELKPKGQDRAHKEGEQRPKAQEHRSKGQESYRREHDNGSGKGGRDQDGGRHRDHEHRHKDQPGKPKDQEQRKQQHPHSDKNKGQHPANGKPRQHDHQRVRDKERDKNRDKERAEPLA
jgi:uncharacterized protein YutD